MSVECVRFLLRRGRVQEAARVGRVGRPVVRAGVARSSSSSLLTGAEVVLVVDSWKGTRKAPVDVGGGGWRITDGSARERRDSVAPDAAVVGVEDVVHRREVADRSKSMHGSCGRAETDPPASEVLVVLLRTVCSLACSCSCACSQSQRRVVAKRSVASDGAVTFEAEVVEGADVRVVAVRAVGAHDAVSAAVDLAWLAERERGVGLRRPGTV